MTTEHQARANRQNAQRSTGPRTPEGRARSSANALRHGVYSSRHDAVTAEVLDEDPAEIDALIQSVVGDLDPQTVLETAVARSIADRIIADNRVSRLEAAILSDCDLSMAERDTIGTGRDEVAFGESLLAAIDVVESPDDENLDGDKPNWVQLIHDVLFRTDPRPRFGLNVTTADGEQRGLVTEGEWRAKFVELLELLYGDLAAARLVTEARIEDHRPAAESETRQIAGTEARRLLVEFERLTVLRERVARGLSHGLKTYRILGEPDDAH